MRTVGIVLAGGAARRMGGTDKGLIKIGGRTILAHIRARLAHQVERIALNANGPAERFAEEGLEIVPDGPGLAAGQEGPAAGLRAGLAWARSLGADMLLTVPCDTPFLPRALVSRLGRAMVGRDAPGTIAASDGELHPDIGLWRLSAAPGIERLLTEGERALRNIATRLGAVTVTFDTSPFDPFQGANTPEEVARLEALHARHPAP